MYRTTIAPRAIKNGMGNGRNLKRSPKGLKGKTSVTPTMSRVEASRYFPGLLWKKDLRVRMTRTMTEAEITDSRNQPVRKESA